MAGPTTHEMAQAIAERKRSLRSSIRSRRGELLSSRDAGGRAVARDALARHLAQLAISLGARSVSCFLPVRGEPDTTGFLDWAESAGVEVLLPVAREGGVLDWAHEGIDEMRVGAFGVPEPTGEALGPHAVHDVGLMLIPAAAIDLRGHRLGWGRGYFDRTLAALAALPSRPAVFAVVHEHELLDEVPVEPHDVPVDGVVTPGGVLEFRRR